MVKRASNHLNQSDKIWEAVYASHVETKDYFEVFYNRCVSSGCREKTLIAYGYHLGRFARWMEQEGIRLENVTKQTIEKYSVDCQREVRNGRPRSKSSVNDDLRVLRNFFGYICDEDNAHLWDGKPLKNPMTKFKLLKSPKQMKPVLNEEQVAMLLRCINRKTFAGHRNFCIILFLWDSAARSSELLNLKRSDFDSKQGTVKVTRKGGRQDVIQLGRSLQQHMTVFERKWLTKIEGDFFFCTRQGKRLQQRNLNHILTRIGQKVGLDWIYPHCFRRSSAQFMARKEVPILAIKSKGGWETLAMVEHYTKEITAEQLRGVYRKNSPGDAIEL